MHKNLERRLTAISHHYTVTSSAQRFRNSTKAWFHSLFKKAILPARTGEVEINHPLV